MNIILFLLGTIGLTHIIVDSSIFAPLREWLKEKAPTVEEPVKCFSGKWIAGKIGYMMTCYQCAGTWVGFLMGFLLLFQPNIGWATNAAIIFGAGMASSFLSNWAAIYLTYLESEIK